MCKFGKKVGADGTCVTAEGYSDDGTSLQWLSLAANITPAERAEFLAIQKYETNAIALNVFMFTAWTMGTITVVVGGVAFLYHKMRVEEESEYRQLPDGIKLNE